MFGLLYFYLTYKFKTHTQNHNVITYNQNNKKLVFQTWLMYTFILVEEDEYYLMQSVN